MWMAFAVGVIAVLAMFAPTMFNNDTGIESASAYFWNYGDSIKGAWPAFVGYMLILAASLASAVIALPFVQPSAKVEKIVLISSIVALGIGLVAVGLLQVEYSLMNSGNVGYTLNDLVYYPGWYITIVFGAIALAMDVIAVKLDW